MASEIVAAPSLKSKAAAHFKTILHRDLLNTMLLDDVEHLVLVVPNRIHNRSPYAWQNHPVLRLVYRYE